MKTKLYLAPKHHPTYIHFVASIIYLTTIYFLNIKSIIVLQTGLFYKDANTKFFCEIDPDITTFTTAENNVRTVVLSVLTTS